MRKRFEQLRRNVLTRRGQQASLLQTLKQSRDGAESLKKTIEAEAQILQLLQATLASTWGRTKLIIEGIVSRGLQSIFFDKDYKFTVEQDVKRGSPVVEFFVVENGVPRDLLDELGGGLVDVVALLLRISFLVLVRPKQRQLLVLDEFSKHVSLKYQENLGKFIREICSELNISILAVTHCQLLAQQADKTFTIEKNDDTCAIVA